MLRVNKTVNQTIENHQDDDECSAQNCTINEIDGAEIYQVKCERCSSWFHVYCVTKYEEQMELDGYVCENCIQYFIVDTMYLISKKFGRENFVTFPRYCQVYT